MSNNGYLFESKADLGRVGGGREAGDARGLVAGTFADDVVALRRSTRPVAPRALPPDLSRLLPAVPHTVDDFANDLRTAGGKDGRQTGFTPRCFNALARHDEP